MDLFSNRGGILNSDVPGQVDSDRDPLGRNNSTGISLRQSQIGLEVFGPDIAGAKTRGDLQADFAGGFQYAPNGIALGLFRMRTATIHLDWQHTSIVAGQDAPFFSALSPTSFATVAEPALSEAGNLWMWIPQIRVERRLTISENSNFTLQGGILDGLDRRASHLCVRAQAAGGRIFAAAGIRWPGCVDAHDFRRAVNCGSGWLLQPAKLGIRPQRGCVGRHAGLERAPRENAGCERRILSRSGAWVVWGEAPIRARCSAGIRNDPASRVQGLDAIGGWAQLKVRASSKVEFNFAGGQDNPFAYEVRAFPFSAYGSGGNGGRRRVTRAGLMNVIYRPRSDLVFSPSIGHIATYQIDNSRYTADRLNLVMGISVLSTTLTIRTHVTTGRLARLCVVLIGCSSARAGAGIDVTAQIDVVGEGSRAREQEQIAQRRCVALSARRPHIEIDLRG